MQINLAHNHHILIVRNFANLKRLSHCKCALNQDENVLLHHLSKYFTTLFLYYFV